MSVIIRQLKKQDISAVEEILSLYWSGDFKDHMMQRVKDFTDHTQNSIDQDFHYFVAEDNNEVVGVAAFRKAPDHMKEYTITGNPVEFYILAVKYQGKGAGKALRDERIKEAKKLGYMEAVLYSGETHQDSWLFHDNSEFKRVGPTIAPNGEPGIIWQMLL